MSVIRYILEVIICSGLFLVFYRWMIAKKVGFRLCRIYLVATMLLSAAIPAMDVPVYTAAPGKTGTALTEIFFFEEYLGEKAASTEAADETQAATQAAAADAGMPATAAAAPRADLRKITAATLGVIYIMVALAGLSLILWNAVRIGRMRRRSKLTYTEEYTLAEHEDIKTPFSFLRTIFMGFNYEPHERRQILTHEASHVRHRHSYERLILSALRATLWFNPFFRMAEKDLEEVQEWEADKDVLAEGHELKTYRTTIFKQLFGYNPDISCGLNHSLTKQRFIMMTQSRRGKGAWIRLAATLPIIAGLFLAFGCGTKEARPATDELTNGTEQTYIDICPPCDATVSNSFIAGKAGRSHTGIDYVLNEGDPVYAVADGEVSSITRDDSNGLMLVLKHADGYETRYAHLSKVDIASDFSIEGGMMKARSVARFISDADHSNEIITGKVLKGQFIGYAGSTGRATGPHLHFELRKDGEPVDPAPHFTSDKPVKAPFMIDVWEGTTKPGEEYFIFCNGKAAKKEEIGQLVKEHFEGEPMHKAVVHIKAQESIPVGVITDIKMELRKVQALRVRYITDDSAIDKRLPMLAVDETVRVMETEEVFPPVLTNVNIRNDLFFRINSADKVLMSTRASTRSSAEEDLPYIVDIKDFDVNILKAVIENAEERETFPEREVQEITMPDGSVREFEVSKAFIILQTDRGTSYDGYTAAMKHITTAYNMIREEFSAEVFGKPLAELSDAEMQVVYRAVRMNVTEPEPKDVPQRR